jgi:predicted membrane channel-forming protein YqfA (hemolysin III family)
MLKRLEYREKIIKLSPLDRLIINILLGSITPFLVLDGKPFLAWFIMYLTWAMNLALSVKFKRPDDV